MGSRSFAIRCTFIDQLHATTCRRSAAAFGILHRKAHVALYLSQTAGSVVVLEHFCDCTFLRNETVVYDVLSREYVLTGGWILRRFSFIFNSSSTQ